MQAPNIPKFAPSAPSNSSGNLNSANLSNQTSSSESRESQNNFATALSRSRGIKVAAKAIIASRDALVQYLKSGGLDLLTSSIEFQQTGSFISSSYVVYTQHQNAQEPLRDFLQRYTDLIPLASKAEEELKGYQSSMIVKTKNEF